MEPNQPAIYNLKKFTPEGPMCRFAGNTVICFVSPSTPIYQALKIAQETLQNSNLRHYFAYLPPSSFHMTVCDLESGNFFVDKDISAYTRGTYSKASSIFQNSSKEKFDMKVLRLFDVQCVRLIVESKEVLDSLRRYRKSVYTTLGLPYNEDYEFHITLSYILRPIPPELEPEYLQIQQKMNDILKNIKISFSNPQLCSFQDMVLFRAMNHTNVTIIGYNRVAKILDSYRFYSDPADTVLHYTIEATNTFRETKPISHIVPFSKSGRQFSLFYDSTGDHTWVREVISSFTWGKGEERNERLGSGYDLLFVVGDQSPEVRLMALRVGQQEVKFFSLPELRELTTSKVGLENVASGCVFNFPSPLLFLYSPKIGKSKIYSINGFQEISSQDCSSEWTHFVSFCNLGGNWFLFSYEAPTGLSNIREVSPSGELRELSNFTKFSYRKGLNHIVPLCNSMLLFCDERGEKFYVVEVMEERLEEVCTVPYSSVHHDMLVSIINK